MAILFHDNIYGPVKSRRFGYSLGINLLPSNSKFCTFNCVYCECGWNPKIITGKVADTQELLTSLEKTLKTIQLTSSPLDALTYAGNGEPTLHPEFPTIANEVALLRDRYAQGKSIILLTNGTTIFKESIRSTLKYIDIPVFKLDSSNEKTLQKINMPNISFSLSEYIDTLEKLNQRIALQTMFFKGTINNENIDNTTEKELNLLLNAYKKINPMYVLIYSIDRIPPLKTLEKIDSLTLQSIAYKIENTGIKVKWV